MTVAMAAETRISHSVARVSAAPAAVPSCLSRHVCDSRSPVQTEAPARTGRVAVVRWRIGVR